MTCFPSPTRDRARWCLEPFAAGDIANPLCLGRLRESAQRTRFDKTVLSKRRSLPTAANGGPQSIPSSGAGWRWALRIRAVAEGGGSTSSFPHLRLYGGSSSVEVGRLRRCDNGPLSQRTLRAPEACLDITRGYVSRHGGLGVLIDPGRRWGTIKKAPEVRGLSLGEGHILVGDFKSPRKTWAQAIVHDYRLSAGL